MLDKCYQDAVDSIFAEGQIQEDPGRNLQTVYQGEVLEVDSGKFTTLANYLALHQDRPVEIEENVNSHHYGQRGQKFCGQFSDKVAEGGQKWCGPKDY